MSQPRDLDLTTEPVDVIVGLNPTQQVVLVEVVTSQGIPGPPGIAGDATPADLIAALGYTPANKAGDAFTGAVTGTSFSAAGIVGTETYAGADADIQIFNVPGVTASFRFSRLVPASVSELRCDLPTGALDYFAKGSATPVARITGTGQITAYGDRVSVKSGAAILFSDGIGYAQLAMGPNQSLIQFSWPSKSWLLFTDGVCVMSIDSAGNMKVKGSVTPNVTPAEFEAALAMPPPDRAPEV